MLSLFLNKIIPSFSPSVKCDSTSYRQLHICGEEGRKEEGRQEGRKERRFLFNDSLKQIYFVVFFLGFLFVGVFFNLRNRGKFQYLNTTIMKNVSSVSYNN